VRLIVFYFLFFISFDVLGDVAATKKYVEKVSARLAKHPNDLRTIVNAGVFFYRRGDYRSAIYYFSAPNLKAHNQYHLVKYFQGICHYKLREYKYSHDVFKYALTIQSSNRKDDEINKYLNKIKRFYRPVIKKKSVATNNKIFTKISVYSGNLSYSTDANKNSGSVTGGYLSLTKNKYVFEGAIEKLTLTFNPLLSVPDYSQTDTVFSIGKFNKSFKKKYRALYHKNSIDSESAFSSQSILLGYDYYFASGAVFGAEAIYSRFSENINSSMFKATQITAKGVFPLNLKFYLLGDLNYSRNDYGGNTLLGTVGEKASLTSLDLGFSLYFKYLSFNLMKTFGEEQFLLKSGGFLIQNSTDLTKNNLNLTITLNFSRKFTISVKHSLGEYLQEGSSEIYENKGTIFIANVMF